VAVTVTLLHHRYGLFAVNLTTIPFTLIAVALGIFLGFRNNTSYDRFWEGRKLWGRLVNTSRSLTRRILTLIQSEESRQRELVYRVIAYVHALRMHLRDEVELTELASFVEASELEALKAENNRPIAILQRLGDRFRALYDAGAIHALHLPALEASLTDLTDIQGGCERIRSTPIPYSYTVLIHRIVAVYCFALPFGLVHSIGLFTPLVVLMVSYAFFGLDAVGDQIEDPFGLDPNDLPLGQLCLTIETNLRQRLGETELPAMPQGPWLT
jgi:putative membrane protein